jgi:hypothetical protein
MPHPLKQRQKVEPLRLGNTNMNQLLVPMKLKEKHLQYGILFLLYLQTKQSLRVVLFIYMTLHSIRNGHIAAKIPCDDNSSPLLNVLVGVAPNLAPAPLELVPPLSTAGELCLYHVDLPPPAQANATTSANATTMITDIAIQNPGDEDVTLPSTSTVAIGVNEITKGAHSEEGEAQAGAP